MYRSGESGSAKVHLMGPPFAKTAKMWDVALEESVVGERGFEVKVLCGGSPGGEILSRQIPIIPMRYLTSNQKRVSFVEVIRKQVQPVSLHTR